MDHLSYIPWNFQSIIIPRSMKYVNSFSVSSLIFVLSAPLFFLAIFDKFKSHSSAVIIE